MKPLIYKVRHKTRKHKTFLLVIVVIFVAGSFVNTINGIYTENEMINSFRKNYEKQAISQLYAYSFGLELLLDTRFNNQLTILSKIANDSVVKQGIASNNYTPAADKLNNLIN